MARPPFRPISVVELKLCWDSANTQFRPEDSCFAVASAVLNRLLGPAWIKRFVLPDAPKADYMRVDLSGPLPQKVSSLLRYFEFAETLVNLQAVDGFEICLDELAHGKVESACSELDAARFLNWHHVNFRFVSPHQKRRGEAYDFELTYPDGLKVAAEVECKFESQPIRPKSVLNSLNHARKQLSDPGIILVKVPDHWIFNHEASVEIFALTEKFLSGTARVKSVKFYASINQFSGELVTRTYVSREISNPRFGDRNWDLFGYERETPSPTGLPPWWIRLTPELTLPK